MIAQLLKGNYLAKALDYNEEKEEYGELIGTNLLIEDTDYIRRVMFEVDQLNKGTRLENRVFHASLNLAIGEDLPNDTFLKVAEEYLQKMGYGNSPYGVFRHYDKPHHHVHVVATRVNFDGGTVKDSFEINKSMKTCRKLEQKYGLSTPVVNHNRVQKTQQEEALERFNVSKAFFKALKDPIELNKIQSFIDPKKLHFLMNEARERNFDDKQLRFFLNRREEQDKSFNLLKEHFFKEKMLSTQLKKDILFRLETSYNTASTKEEFFQILEKQGVQAEIKSDKNGNDYLIYSLEEKNFYISENKLPDQYKILYINNFKSFAATIEADHKDQKQFLKRNIFNCLYQTREVDSFKNALASRGITIKMNENSDGVKGISFKSERAINGEWFKGSDLHKSLSWPAIENYFKEISQESKEFKNTQKVNVGEKVQEIINTNVLTPDEDANKETKNKSQHNIPSVGSGSQKSEDVFDEYKKRKKRKKRD